MFGGKRDLLINFDDLYNDNSFKMFNKFDSPDIFNDIN
jgi:hypothetical protein